VPVFKEVRIGDGECVGGVDELRGMIILLKIPKV